MEKVRQLAMVMGLGWLSWLGMMLVHETGHVVAAVVMGGRVVRVVWWPWVFSRTDVEPNPWPLVEVWGGPVVGSLVPVGVYLVVRGVRWRWDYLVGFFAGFCLVANGLYIGSGVVDAVGDAQVMIRLGMPVWGLGVFGAVATGVGLWVWHLVSGRVGIWEGGAADWGGGVDLGLGCGGCGDGGGVGGGE